MRKLLAPVFTAIALAGAVPVQAQVFLPGSLDCTSRADPAHRFSGELQFGRDANGQQELSGFIQDQDNSPSISEKVLVRQFSVDLVDMPKRQNDPAGMIDVSLQISSKRQYTTPDKYHVQLIAGPFRTKDEVVSNFSLFIMESDHNVVDATCRYSTGSANSEGSGT